MIKKNIVPVTIIIIGIIISGGIFFSRLRTEVSEPESHRSFEIISISPINKNDHILGNPNAKIIIVEFSHLECVFTKIFHENMRRIITEYGPTGKVAWIIRHYPVPEIYTHSQKAAVATECVSEYGKNNDNPAMFWEYVDKLFVSDELNIDDTVLRRFALEMGVDGSYYDSCILTNPNRNKIARDIEDAEKLISADINFVTPYNLIITNTGLQMKLSGALPYFELRDLIEEILFIIE